MTHRSDRNEQSATNDRVGLFMMDIGAKENVTTNRPHTINALAIKIITLRETIAAESRLSHNKL